MSVEAATAAATRRDPDALVAALITLSEKERRSLHATLTELTEATPEPNRKAADLDRCFFIALWGTGTSRDLRNTIASWRFVPDHRLAEVAAVRPKKTIDALVRASLGDEWNRGPWFVVRDLIRCGTIEHPEDEAYYVGLTRALSLVVGERRHEHGPEPIAEAIVEWLRGDADLPGELLRATEYEEAANRISGPVADGWLLAFKTAVESSILDRDVVLDLCLAGQLRDLRRSASSFFRKLFESLEPSFDEEAQRADALVRILAAARPAEQAAAAKTLRALADGGAVFHADAVASGVAAPLSGSHKGAAMAALQLVAAVPLSPAERAGAAVHGLGHPHYDVQEASLRILEDGGDDLPAHVRADAMLWAETVAPSLRERVSVLIGVDLHAVDEATADEVLGDDQTRLAHTAFPGSNLGERIGEGLRGELPGPLTFAPWSLPDHGSRVHPITDVDELVSTLTILLAGSGTPIDLERVIDGLGRCDPATIPNAALSPVRAAFRQDYAAPGWYGWEVRGHVEVAARHWCDRKTPARLPYLSPNKRLLRRAQTLSHDLTAPPRDAEGQWWAAAFDDSSHSAGILGFLSARLWEAVTAATTAPRPSLSLPSRTTGWVDPNDLIERLAVFHERKISPGRFDAVQALLRLRPGQAGERAFDGFPSTPILPAIQAFLGADVSVPEIALARAVAETPPPEVIRLVSFPKEKHNPGFTVVRYETHSATPDLRRDDPVGQLTAELAPPTERPNVGTRWTPAVSALFAADQLLVDWTVIGLPRHRDIVAARAAALLAEDLDANRSGDCLHSLLSAATAPDEPLTFAMHVLLATGLADRNAVTSSSAADLLHDAASDGRLDPSLLGGILGGLSNGGIIKPARFAKSSKSVVPVSPLIAERVRQVLCGWLGAVTGVPRDMHAVLETLEIACSVSGSGVAEEHARDKLTEAAAGSSKRAKAARRLLDLPLDTSPTVAALATRSLLDRAHRWTGDQSE